MKTLFQMWVLVIFFAWPWPILVGLLGCFLGLDLDAFSFRDWRAWIVLAGWAMVPIGILGTISVAALGWWPQ